MMGKGWVAGGLRYWLFIARAVVRFRRILSFFHACLGEIEALTNRAWASVEGPAKRVLTAMGVHGGGAVEGMNGSANNGSAVAAPAPVAPPTNFWILTNQLLR